MRNRADRMIQQKQRAERDSLVNEAVARRRAAKQEFDDLRSDIERLIPLALSKLRAANFSGAQPVATTGFMGRSVSRAGWVVHTKATTQYGEPSTMAYHLLSDGTISPFGLRDFARYMTVPTVQQMRKSGKNYQRPVMIPDEVLPIVRGIRRGLQRLAEG